MFISVKSRFWSPCMLHVNACEPTCHCRHRLASEQIFHSLSSSYARNKIKQERLSLRLRRRKGKRAAPREDEAPPPPTDADADELGQEVEAMPQFRGHLGARFKTCRPVALTEEGLEYVVTVVKHIFERHVVLQFNCTNTFKEQVRAGTAYSR